MEENQDSSSVTQLRKSIEKLGFSTEKYSDPSLMRFLIARSMDTEKATKMFVEWLKWRSTMVPSGFISESEVPEHLEAGKVCLQGLSSKNQLPVAVVRASKHYPAKDQPQFKKFVVYMLDKIIASSFKGQEIGNEKLIGIIDLQQIAYKNADPRGLITGFQFLQAYYPERLGKCYIVNMPGFFVAIWRMVSRFLDKATLKKIVIVTNEDEKKELIEEIGVDILPEEYGGKAKFIAIHESARETPELRVLESRTGVLHLASVDALHFHRKKGLISIYIYSDDPATIAFHNASHTHTLERAGRVLHGLGTMQHVLAIVIIAAAVVLRYVSHIGRL